MENADKLTSVISGRFHISYYRECVHAIGIVQSELHIICEMLLDYDCFIALEYFYLTHSNVFRNSTF